MIIQRLIAALAALFLAATTTSRGELFVATYEAGPAWRDGAAVMDQPGGPAHVEYLNGLADEGALLTGGPFASMDSGLSILRADSLEEAREMVMGDPIVRSEAMRVAVQRWRPLVSALDWTAVAPATETEAAQAVRVLDLLGGLAGREWIHEGEAPDGSAFLVRSRLEIGPDGESILGHGWLGGADGMYYHALTTVWRAPRGGARFLNINQRGAVARGSITLQGEDMVVWDWNETTPGGDRTEYVVEMTFDETRPDSYGFRLFLMENGERRGPLTDIRYRAVEKVPAQFKKMRTSEEGAMGDAETWSDGVVIVRAQREGEDR